MHGVERDTLWKKLNEAMCVLKLMYYQQVVQHYKSLKKDHEMTLNFLMRVNEDRYVMSKFEPIVNYRI